MRGKARRIGFIAGACMALVTLLGVAPTHAQTDHPAERLITELEMTDHILERAREVVEQSGNERAIHELKFAFTLQEQAKNLARSTDASLTDFQRSAELTARARQLAQRAVTIASQQIHLEQRARLLIEQLERALEQASARLGDAPNDRAERLLAIATRRLEQARESFLEQRYQEAIHMVQETIKLLQNLGAPTPGRQLERMFDNIQRLLERAESEAAENPQAAAMIERARLLIEQARANFQNGQPVAAERRLQQARDLLLNAMRLSDRPLDAGHVDLLLEETMSYVQDIAAQVRDAGDPQAATLAENALRHMERARELRAAGKLRQALEEARVARNLARRAAQAAGIPQP